MRIAYAPGGVLDRITTAHVMERYLNAGNKIGKKISLPAPREFMNAHDLYPIRTIRPKGRPRFSREVSRTHDGVQPDGFWQITLTFGDERLANVKTKLKQNVVNVAEVGHRDSFLDSRRQTEAMVDLIKVLESGITLLAETHWGADHAAWPADAKAFDTQRKRARKAFAKLTKIQNLSKTEVSKMAEIDALTSVEAARNYDVDADWPSGTLTPPVPPERQ